MLLKWNCIPTPCLLVYSNERRLVLQGLLWDKYKSANIASISSHKPKHLLVSARDSASPACVCRSMEESSLFSLLFQDCCSFRILLQHLQIPDFDESQGSVKKLNCNKIDLVEGTPRCEECRRAKRQQLSEERSSYQENSPDCPKSSESCSISSSQD